MTTYVSHDEPSRDTYVVIDEKIKRLLFAAFFSLKTNYPNSLIIVLPC